MTRFIIFISLFFHFNILIAQNKKPSDEVIAIECIDIIDDKGNYSNIAIYPRCESKYDKYNCFKKSILNRVIRKIKTSDHKLNIGCDTIQIAIQIHSNGQLSSIDEKIKSKSLNLKKIIIDVLNSSPRVVPVYDKKMKKNISSKMVFEAVLEQK